MYVQYMLAIRLKVIHGQYMCYVRRALVAEELFGRQ